MTKEELLNCKTNEEVNALVSQIEKSEPQFICDFREHSTILKNNKGFYHKEIKFEKELYAVFFKTVTDMEFNPDPYAYFRITDVANNLDSDFNGLCVSINKDLEDCLKSEKHDNYSKGLVLKNICRTIELEIIKPKVIEFANNFINKNPEYSCYQVYSNRDFIDLTPLN